MVRAGVQVRDVVQVRVVRPLDRTNYSVQRAIPSAWGGGGGGGGAGVELEDREG